ncbi:hypothetical protein SLS62_011190 [Diatrype stigma]|uniref:Uncharacterized protein n=1 Tax=Diatrype stigma TaxID=117547 RepID=A0AAN9U5N5_9PEZI
MRLLRPDTITDIHSGSWPPSPSRQPPSLDEDNSTEDELDMPPPLLQEEDPLTYFLTPATPKNQEEDLEFDFDFDAGIESSNRPRDIVRNVSPSTLDGLKKYKPKSQGQGQSQSKAPDCAILDDDDDDDDDEDYIHFEPASSQPLGYDDYFLGLPRSSKKRPGHNKNNYSSSSSSFNSELDHLSPASYFHVGSPRGRPAKRFAPPRRPPGGSSSSSHPTLRRRHSWREPSPDVWSIEEEPEKETMSEMGMGLGLSAPETLTLGPWGEKKTQPIDIPDAKPKKRVRFVLPVEE